MLHMTACDFCLTSMVRVAYMMITDHIKHRIPPRLIFSSVKNNWMGQFWGRKQIQRTMCASQRTYVCVWAWRVLCESFGDGSAMAGYCFSGLLHNQALAPGFVLPLIRGSGKEESGGGGGERWERPPPSFSQTAHRTASTWCGVYCRMQRILIPPVAYVMGFCWIGVA